MAQIPDMPLIGKNLRSLRKKLQITLDELAKVSGVSKGMLSQIEKEKANPTVSTMWKISKGLGVDLNTILGSQDNERLFYVNRAESMNVITNKEKNCALRVITPPQLVDKLELYWLTFDPGGALISEPHFSFTEEMVTVIDGQLEVSAGDKTTLLQKGDTVRYHADVEHVLREVGNAMCEVYMAVYFPDTAS